MAEKSKKPAIRFAGFTEAWEQRKLGNLASFSKGYGYSKSDLLESGTPIILYGRLYTNYETVISDVDTYANEKKGSVYSRGGEVIVPASGETAEDISVASVVEKQGVLLGGDLNIINPVKILNSGFLAISISNGNPHKEMAKMAQGKSVVHLHNADLEKINLNFPSCDEQVLISTYFQNIDNLITLHQRKYDKLVNVKKAMLEKMFPKDGADVPEIRFKGFTEAWEQRKVGELLIERNEQAPMSDDYPLMAFIANEGVTPKGDRYDRSSLVNDVSGKLYKHTEFGDFIYSSNNLESGSIGLNKYGNACISPVYSIFQSTEISDPEFIGRRFLRKDFINSMIKWRQGVIYGQWRIHESDFVKIEVIIPSLIEQKRVGKFLNQLDNLITLHQRKLEKLKNLKKACLEKMFV